MSTVDLVLRGGRVIDPARHEAVPADVHLHGDRIVAVVEHGAQDADTAAEVLDCTGRLILPGFVDTHSHADAAVFDPDVQHALLRDGVTTIVAGQDGVSFAPGDGDYATEYFRALNGRHPGYSGGGVGMLLDSYQGRTRLNIAYLVPHGTVRFEVMGLDDRPPNDAELATMLALVAAGLSDGAVGLSSGLDYVPGRFAATSELAVLCTAVAAADAVYVTHMRGGYEHNSSVGIDEVIEICQRSGARAHVSHYHGPGPELIGLLDSALQGGSDITFDAYPYRSGCTLLSMPMLPDDLLVRGTDATLAALADDAVRSHLIHEYLPGVARLPYMGQGWSERLTLAHIAAPKYGWCVGMSLQAAAAASGRGLEDFTLDLLSASRLDVSAVLPLPPGRSIDELAMLVRHPAHMVGSDGIYQVGHPHPRGWGTFGRILSRHVRERADLTWSQASHHLSSAPVNRFGLGQRGAVRPGWMADLIVVDPETVADRATYASPRELTLGIDDVLVAGIPVLRRGALTNTRPGRGVRRGG